MPATHVRLMLLFGFVALFFGQSHVIAQAGAAAHDLQYILDKPLLAFWSHPSEHLKNPALGEFFVESQKAIPSLEKRQDTASFLKQDSFKISLCLGRNQWTDKLEPTPVVIYRYNDPAVAAAKWQSMAAGLETKTVPELKFPISIFKRPVPRGEPEPETDWKLELGKAQLDPQTLVEGNTAEMLIKALTAPATTHQAAAWAKEFPNWSKSQSLLLLDMTQWRDQLKQKMKQPPSGMGALIIGNVMNLLEQADYAFVGIETTDGIQVMAIAQSATPEAAQRFKGALEGVIGLGKGFLPMLKQSAAQMNQEMPGMGDFVTTELDNLVNGISITQVGTQTKLTWTMKQDVLARLVKLLIPAFRSAQARAIDMQAQHQVMMLGMALMHYHQSKGHFPPAVILGKDGKTTHSWRVALLPFIENDVYGQYKFDEPWDSEHNKKLIAKIPRIYRLPSGTNAPGSTNIAVLTHPKGMFTATPSAKGTSLDSITDGADQTILCVETNAEIPWTKPEDLPVVDGQPLPALGFPGAKVLKVAFCGGSVHKFALPVKNDLFRALVTIADGVMVNVQELEPAENQPDNSAAKSPSTKEPAAQAKPAVIAPNP